MPVGLRSPEVIPDDVILAFGTNMDGPITLSSAGVAANTALAGVLIGTPVVSASAANSVYIANITASGDIIIAANRGGNSESYLEIDSSAGQLSLNARGTGSLLLRTNASTQLTIDSAGLVTTVGGISNTGTITQAGNILFTGNARTIDFGTGIGPMIIRADSDIQILTDVVTTDVLINPQRDVYLQSNGVTVFRITPTAVGFFAVTPAARASAYTQTFATADKTHAARVGTAVATTAATNTSPFGYTTAAQADAIVQELNDTILDLADTAQLLNAVIDDLQAYGLFQ